MIIETANYGLCLFSPSAIHAFLKKRKKTRTKNLLKLFQNNESLYIEALEEGIMIPISPIPSIEYQIEILCKRKENYIFNYKDFNLNIKNNDLWLCDIGKLTKFDKSLFNDNREFFYFTYDNEKVINGVNLDIPTGKYLVNISGFSEDNTFCFSFQFEKVNHLVGYNDPRDEEYQFIFEK